MKKSLRLGALAVAAALTLAACSPAPDSDTPQSPADTGSQSENGTESDDAGTTVKACMVSDSGGFDDKSFNQSGYEGLQKAAAELGVEVATAESHDDTDYIPNIENMVQEGCNIIIGVGFLMADAMDEAAVKYPDTSFALVDSGFASAPANAKSLMFNTAEAGYLAGYASAAMSQTGKVGTYLGMKLPTTAIFADGFSDGIVKYNEVKGTDVQLLGWDKEAQDGMAVGNFEDTGKGKTFTEQLFEQGADVVMPVAGPVGAGTLAAASENEGTMVVWVDADGVETNADYSSVILTSVMKQIGQAVFDAVEGVVNGTFSSETYVGTLENGGVGIAPWHDFADKVPADLDAEIEGLIADITSGAIVVETVNAP